MQFLSLFDIVNPLPRIADRQSIIFYAAMQEQWDSKIKYIFPGNVFFICTKRMEEFEDFCKNKYSNQDELKNYFMEVVNMMNSCQRDVYEIVKYIAKFEQDVVRYVTLFAFNGYTGAITYKKNSRSKNVFLHKMIYSGYKLKIFDYNGKDTMGFCRIFDFHPKIPFPIPQLYYSAIPKQNSSATPKQNSSPVYKECSPPNPDEFSSLFDPFSYFDPIDYLQELNFL